MCSLPDFFPNALLSARSIFAVACINKEEEWDEEQQENIQRALLEEMEDKLCTLSKRISMDKLLELRQCSVYEEDIMYYKTSVGHVGSITAVEREVVYGLENVVAVTHVFFDSHTDYLATILHDCLVNNQYAMDTVFLSMHEWEPNQFSLRKAHSASVKEVITSLLNRPVHTNSIC